MTRELIVGPIVLDIWPTERDNADSPMCGCIVVCIPQDMDHAGTVFSGRIDGIESLVLAHACGGVDVEDDKYVEGVQSAIDACLNQE